jgi:hypothetical protein
LNQLKELSDATRYRISGAEDLTSPNPFVLPLPPIPVIEYKAEDLKDRPELAEKLIHRYAVAYTGEYLEEFKASEELVKEQVEYVKVLENEYFEKAVKCEESQKELGEAQVVLNNRMTQVA